MHRCLCIRVVILSQFLDVLLVVGVGVAIVPGRVAVDVLLMVFLEVIVVLVVVEFAQFLVGALAGVDIGLDLVGDELD